MSISSMLGGEPEKSAQEAYPNHNSKPPSRQGSLSGPAVNLFSAMSPPQQPSKPGLGEYSYKPRSQTPDRIGPSFSPIGSRQRSSSSGTPLHRPAPIVEQHHRSASTIPAPRYFDHPASSGFNGVATHRAEQEERVRRTSLSGILQRPNSQPPTVQPTGQLQDPFRQNGVPVTFLERASRPEPISTEQFRLNGTHTPYDIKPPMSHNLARTGGPPISPTRVTSLPDSPDSQRLGAGATQGRTLASILNGPTAPMSEPPYMAAQKMSRQDSAQSQTDRAIFGDRGKFRQYSPFASSLNSQVQSTTGQPAEEPMRKGSDELSQHRTLLSTLR